MNHRGLSLLAVILLVVLAGCSGASGPATTPNTEDPTPTNTTVTTQNGTVEVHFINVGQSVSTLIVGPTGETMLVDSGHYRDDGEYVLSYLNSQDIDRIDYFVVSHNDADHIGGNAQVIEYYETQANGIGAVYDPGIAASTQTYTEYLDAVEEHDVTLYETREGDSIPFEGVAVTVMGPPEPYLENDARNENSIVLKLGYGQTSFLLTGDAEDDQEEYLVDTYGERLNSTILKAGHHGSASSTGGALLDASSPKAVVVSSGWDNQYGHPSEETLSRLAERNIPTYWTATHGTVVLTSDGQAVAVASQQAAPTDPSQLREGSPIEPGTAGAVERRTVIREHGGGDIPTPTATPTATQTTVSDGGAAVDVLTISEIHADAEGDESENLNDEYIVFENTGSEPLDIGGWTVSDSVGQTYTVPEGVSIPAGETITLHTGSGTDTSTDLYWGSGSAIWNNGGDTVIVATDTGQEVLRQEY